MANLLAVVDLLVHDDAPAQIIAQTLVCDWEFYYRLLKRISETASDDVYTIVPWKRIEQFKKVIGMAKSVALNRVRERIAFYDQFELIKFLPPEVGNDFSGMCAMAAENGALRCLATAVVCGFQLTPDVCQVAAREGHLACLKLAHELGCRCMPDVAEIAARQGHLACVKYAYSHGLYHGESYAAMTASASGHLDCLRYLMKHRCPTFKVCASAIQNRHYDCLVYACEHGASVDRYCLNLVLSHHLGCIEKSAGKIDTNIATQTCDCFKFWHYISQHIDR